MDKSRNQKRVREADDQATSTVHQVTREQHNNVILHSDSEADRGAKTEKNALLLSGEDWYRMNKNSFVYNLRQGNKKVLISCTFAFQR